MSVGYVNKGRRVFAQIGWALLVASCTSTPAAAPRTSVRLDPTPASAPASSDRSGTGGTSGTAKAPAPLPALPTSSGTISDGGGPRIQALDADGLELGVVVRALAQQFNLQYQVDPAVRGKVYARLRNATLSEALNQILPQGATYDISNRTLRVSAARVDTRTFTLDYVAISRFGTAATVIQRRLGSSGGGIGQTGGQGGGLGAGGGGGGFGGGADVITATSVANVWEDIRIAVEALVFERSAGPATPGQSAAADPFAASGTRSYSRTEPDGRRLIVNPMAGTITVSAYPASLAEVESFIKTFEASIQRQVLIEAKIVEVSLEDSTEFGIDWNFIARNDKALLTIRSSPSGAQQSSGNVEFRLGGGEVTGILNALQSQGSVRVLSSPRVSALNNQRAVFNVTTGEIFFSTTRTQTGFAPNGTPIFETQVTPQQVNVGIVLDVIPQISADNGVTMNIRPVVTSVSRTAQTVQDGNTHTAPVIDTRESDTMARLRGGETIIIGGLMQTRSLRVESGIPVLKSIPLLGRLFRHSRNVEKKSELVIFLTPTIISGQPPAGR